MLNAVEQWAEDNGIKIAGGKTAIVVVSEDARECNGKANTSFRLAGKVVPPSKEVAILGVTTDLCKPCTEIEKKNGQQNVRTHSFRERTEFPLLTTSGEYNTYARPRGLFAAEILTHFLSESKWQKLETSNNRASSITTGTPSVIPSAASRLDTRTPSYRILVEDNAALLLEIYRRFPETPHLNQLCQQTVKPRLRSRGENTHRPDWREEKNSARKTTEPGRDFKSKQTNSDGSR